MIHSVTEQNRPEEGMQLPGRRVTLPLCTCTAVCTVSENSVIRGTLSSEAVSVGGNGTRLQLEPRLPAPFVRPGLKRNAAYNSNVIVQELCESRGGRPGLSVLTSLLVSVDVKNY